MIFSLKTKVIGGRGCLEQLGETVEGFGVKKALLCTDAFLAGTPAASRIVEMLERRGIRCPVYTRLQPEPIDVHCDEGAPFCAENGVELIVALGGGSVITNWPVDLSAVSSLTASINKFDPTETYSAFNIYLLSAWPTINADNSYVAAVRVLGNQQATSVTLNTSGYNGSYYVLMGFSNNNSRSFTGYIYSLKCNF